MIPQWCNGVELRIQRAQKARGIERLKRTRNVKGPAASSQSRRGRVKKA
jgi:hypothetical protein